MTRRPPPHLRALPTTAPGPAISESGTISLGVRTARKDWIGVVLVEERADGARELGPWTVHAADARLWASLLLNAAAAAEREP